MPLLRVANPNSQRFLNSALSHLRNSGIRVDFFKTRDSSRFQIDGYFDAYNRKLAVFRQPTHGDTIAIFVHEYCHFLIWSRQTPQQRAYNTKNNPDAIIERWLERKIPYSDLVHRAFVAVKQEEIDCDKMAYKFIQQFDLPVNHKQFIMEANRQLIRYTCVEHTRKWAPEGNFFHCKELERLIPGKYLKSSYVRCIPKRILKQALKEYC
jgi:hypothetical protein